MRGKTFARIQVFSQAGRAGTAQRVSRLYPVAGWTYKAGQDGMLCDHHSNYQPGALTDEPPGQGVWMPAPI